MADPRHFAVSRLGTVAIIQLQGPRLFDTLVVSDLQDELIAFLETERPKSVVVSFGGVTHCATAVINALLQAKKRIVSGGGELKLCSMSEAIREGYRILNLDGTVFKIYPSKEEALASF